MLQSFGEIERFAATATPGDMATYGRGAHPPRELVTQMRELVEADVLHPVARREGAERLFMVQRGRAPMPDRSPRAARGFVRRKRVRRSSISMVMACLTVAAVNGRACPTNEEIAERCHLSGRDAARYRLKLLVQRGRIAVDNRGPLERRVVTILTGKHAGAATAKVAA
ncbi:MAG: hypothetical protein AAF692_08415 [Pseudomonadota bacterium]